jgi:hypothetical protein
VSLLDFLDDPEEPLSESLEQAFEMDGYRFKSDQGELEVTGLAPWDAQYALCKTVAEPTRLTCRAVALLRRHRELNPED